MTREKNLRPELSRRARNCRIRPTALGAHNFIRNTRLGDVKDDGIARLRLIKNKAGRRDRGIPLIVEVMSVNEESSSPTKQQHTRKRSRTQP